MLTTTVRAFPGAAGFLFRRTLYRRLLAACGGGAIFGRHVEIRRPDRVRLGRGVILSDRCLLDAGEGEGSEIVIGDGVFLGVGTVIRAAGTVEIGAGTNVGSSCTLSAKGKVLLGRNVLLAAYVSIGGEEPRAEVGRQREQTVVEDGCWLGVRVRLSEGVRVGHDSVVGAHAVVEDDIPPFAVAYGNPARVMKERRSRD